MTAEDVDDKIEDSSLASESSLRDIYRIWDLRTLLNSSSKRLLELNKETFPDKKSIQLERAIIRGVTKEIRKLKSEALFP